MSSPSGRFVWYDLMTTDPSAAQDFYPDVVDWSLTPYPGSDPPYTMWMVGEGPVGGSMGLPEEALAQGAVIALFTPAGEMAPHPDWPRMGDFSWNELVTDDHEAAFTFYARLFGWEKTGSLDMGPLGEYLTFGQGETTYGGMWDRPEEVPVNAWLHYVRVADLEEAVDRVERGGGKVINPPREVPGGDRIAQCVDPQGGHFALHEIKQGS